MQTLAAGQLRKCETKELIETGKATEFIMAAAALYAFGELAGRNVTDQPVRRQCGQYARLSMRHPLKYMIIVVTARDGAVVPVLKLEI